MMHTFFGAEFLETKFSAIDGKTYIMYTEQSQEKEPFNVKVSSSGMSMEGKLSKEITTERDLQDFAKMISEIWVKHRTLAPKLVTSLSGH